VRTVCQCHSLVNYAVVQLGRKRTLVHWSIPDLLPARRSNFSFSVRHLFRTIPVFCIKLPNFIYIGSPNAEVWRQIDFSRWWPQRLSTISGFLLVNVTVFRRSNLSTKKISSTYLKSWLIYNYFRFGKRNGRVREFYFRFWFRSYHANRMLFCIMLLNFIQIGPPAAEIRRHIHFFSMAAATA